MTRLSAIARVHLLVWRSVVGWPWGVLAVAFVGNLVLATGSDVLGWQQSGSWSTSLLAMLVVMFIAYVMAPSRYLPFSLAMGVTRRGCYGATVLAAGLESVVYGTVLYLLRTVEDATGGWWLDLVFFGIVPLDRAGAVLQWLLFVVSLFVVTMLGLCLGAAFLRLGARSLLVATVLGVLGWVVWNLLARSGLWVPMGDWSLLAVAAVAVAVAAALAATGYLALRRAAA